MNRNAPFVASTPLEEAEARIVTEEEQVRARRKRASEMGIQLVGRL